MSTPNNEPPDGGTGFSRSSMTYRTPPNNNKRIFSETLSPSYVSPANDSCKRPNVNLSAESIKTHHDNSVVDHEIRSYYDLVNEASSYLSKINDIVNDAGTRINVANKSAIMDMTQRVTAIVSLLAIQSSSTETKLAQVERDLLSSKINNNKPVASQDTYASRVGLKLPKLAPVVETRTPLPCVVAYPTEERSADFKSSSATKEALMKAIKPSDGFQIVGIKKTAKAGVVLRVTNDKQIKKLESVEGIKSAGLRLEKPQGRKPRILIKDVPGSIDDNAFLNYLYSQNVKDEYKISQEDFIKSTKIVRRRPMNNGRKWVGIEIDPNIRKHFINTKEKIFIDWANCRFIDDIEIVRCLKCQQYGHVAKFCNESEATCGHCAGGHDSRLCSLKNSADFKPICAPCKRYKKPCDHACGSSDCPSYKAKLEQLILTTNYG